MNPVNLEWNIYRSPPLHAISEEPCTKSVPVCPVRSIHRDPGVERRRRPSQFIVVGHRPANDDLDLDLDLDEADGALAHHRGERSSRTLTGCSSAN